MNHKMIAQREAMKALVRNGAMPRATAEKILATERHNETRPRLETRTDGDVLELRIYDYIDSWGGYWGVSASEVAELLDRADNPTTIILRLNSPGGEVTEGVVIHNLLADHAATVNVVVDGMAASIASVIAMAGDTVTMNRGSEMMIHNAWGIAVGDASEMRKYGELLDRATRTAAGFYQARAGGDLDDWLDLMTAETWFDADEAVEAGLADDKVALKTKTSEGEMNSWDRAIFASAPDAGDIATMKKIFGENTLVDSTSDDAPDADEAAAKAAAELARQRAEQVAAEAMAVSARVRAMNPA